MAEQVPNYPRGSRPLLDGTGYERRARSSHLARQATRLVRFRVTTRESAAAEKSAAADENSVAEEGVSK